MSKNTLVIALCVAAAATAGMTLSRVAFAQTEAGNPVASHNPHGPLEAFHQRSRDAQPPFDFVHLNNMDLVLGRRYLVLQGNAPGPDLSSSHALFATAEHVMDVRTLTYSGNNGDGTIFFLKNFGEVPIQDALRAVVQFDEGRASTTIHFDPPIRIDERDVIMANMQRVDDTRAGIVLLSLHGTVPAGAGGGDVMLVE